MSVTIIVFRTQSFCFLARVSMTSMEVDPAPAQQLDNGAEEGATLKRKSDRAEGHDGEPTLAMWKRWVQGPFAVFMRNDKE